MVEAAPAVGAFGTTANFTSRAAAAEDCEGEQGCGEELHVRAGF
jgi:hypothetical protein